MRVLTLLVQIWGHIGIGVNWALFGPVVDWIECSSARILDLVVQVKLPTLDSGRVDASVAHCPDQLTGHDGVANSHVLGMRMKKLMREAVLVLDGNRSVPSLACPGDDACHR